MKRTIYTLFFITYSLTAFHACIEKEIYSIPSVATDTIERVDLNSAIAKGTISDLGMESGIIQHGHVWSSVNPNPTIKNDSFTKLGEKYNKGSFTSKLSNLDSSTNYIRAYAINNLGPAYGEPKPLYEYRLPGIFMGKIESVSDSSAEISAILYDLGINQKVVQHGLCWSDSDSMPTVLNDTNELGQTSYAYVFIGNMINLKHVTKYYVRAYAIDDINEVRYSENTLSFTTNAKPPIIETIPNDEITSNLIKCGGRILDNGGAEIIETGVCWSKKNNPSIADSILLTDDSSKQEFILYLENLPDNDSIFYRAFARNNSYPGYGKIHAIKALSGLPIIESTVIDSVGFDDNYITVNFAYNEPNDVIEKGVCWSVTPHPFVTSDSSTYEGQGSNDFKSEIKGLTMNTKYYMRAYAINNIGTYYGRLYNFTTNYAEIPSLTIEVLSNVSCTSIMVASTIKSDGGSRIHKCGFCWNYTGEIPTINDWHIDTVPSQGTFSSLITGLLSDTVILMRSYAINEIGIAYSNEHLWHIERGKPEPDFNTSNKYVKVGEVIDFFDQSEDHYYPITSWLWKFGDGNTSTEPNPSHVYNQPGVYNVSLTVSNGCGSNTITKNNYITIVSFISGDTGTLTDIDGNTYNTIAIGKQFWMAENLKVIHYADGTALLDGTGVGNITNNYNSQYYFYYDDDVSNNDSYGKLYTWAAVMGQYESSNTNPSGVQGICPTGWHVPSDKEWIELEEYLGMNSEEALIEGAYRGTNEGGKLKIKGFTHWASPNTGATNESGFSAIGSGSRHYEGFFEGMHHYTFFYSCTEKSAEEANRRALKYDVSTIYSGYIYKTKGYSVRCVKD